jgi:hypothetical protein
MARTKTTQRKSSGPHGVPRHQVASRHEGSSSGSYDPIGAGNGATKDEED